MQKTHVEVNQVEEKQKLSDIQDWTALKAGSQVALKTIYEAHISALIKYGIRFSKDSQLVEDCVHDLFVDLWRRREALGITDSIRRYLLVSLRRRIIAQIKRSGKTQGLVKEEGPEAPFTSSIEHELIGQEGKLANQAKLAQAMAKLSARQQEAIYLKYQKNLTYQDISEVMDINYQSVRNLVYSGIQKMRTMMTMFCLAMAGIGHLVIEYIKYAL